MSDETTPIRKCRVCGCTDDNCATCIERTGEPCSWVEADLCSACVKLLIDSTVYVARDFLAEHEANPAGAHLSICEAASFARSLVYLNTRVAELERALTESVSLQSHYAALLNMHDGGHRMMFVDRESWLARLRELAEAGLDTDPPGPRAKS